MKKIALTGNMGTGKSYVSQWIKRLGFFVLDMDVCAKEVRAAKKEELFSVFHVSDEEELARIVFQEECKKTQLEEMLYPAMIETMQTFFKMHEAETLVFVEVPLLFEKGWEVYFDEVWCVVCDEETALKRLCEYRLISKEEARARLKHQMPMEEKARRSDVLIYNNEEDDVERQIKALVEREK